MRPTVAFHTLGCKLNFAESSALARDLAQAGYQRVDLADGADVVVINTCSVTQQADAECKTVVRRALKANPDAFVAVTGCYAQLKPSEVAAMEGVDLVLGAKEKMNLPHFLEDLHKRPHAEIHACEIQDVDQFTSAFSIGDRTRAFLKVQDGCDYKCTYCTIPLARGISRSAPVEQVLRDAQNIVEQGIQEVVLTGVNIGDYGKGEMGNKRHEHTFLDLLHALDGVDGLDRIRISSIEPNLLSDEIIDFTHTSKRFVPHFHIPLQSGNNEILGKMKRRYQRELYQERVERILSTRPDACIGVDVIVGFPGETEEHFLDTYRFLEQLPIGYLHVFTYSERANTAAADYPGAVPLAERKARNHRLRLLSAMKQRAFSQLHVGSVRRVLWESENRDGRMLGYTENYLRMHRPFDPNRVHTVEHVTVGAISADGTLEALPLSPTA